MAFLSARRVVIRGWSMSPTLAPGEHVLFDRIAYRLGPPGRGDVVLVRHPARPGLRLVKRLAALPGDAVVIADDRCWVNGLPWVAEAAPPDVDEPPGEPRILAADEYLLLGDALPFSTDSRQLGPVSRRSIQARAWMVYWPRRAMRNISGAS
ncbi:MAG: signal peptidase I [Dehalococcoidia bacterium]